MTECFVLQYSNLKIIRCNESAEKIFSFSYDQMLGKKSIDPDWQSIYEDGSAFPGDTHPAMVLMRNGKAQEKVIMGVRQKDRGIAWISINATPLFKAGKDKATFAITTFQDITVDLQKTKQLRLLNNLIDKSPDIVQVNDIKGNYVYANQAALKELNYTLSELLTKNAKEIVRFYTANPTLRETRANKLRTIKQSILERTIKTSDQREIYGSKCKLCGQRRQGILHYFLTRQL